MLFMGLGGILWIAVLAFVVFWLFKMISGGRHDSSSRDLALTTLGQEYASGRIDREEYLRRKSDLT